MERADVFDQHMQFLQRLSVVALRHAGLQKRTGAAEMGFIGADRGQPPGIHGHIEPMLDLTSHVA
jgi:hypothetical protein